MSKFQVRLTETIAYDKSYERAELIPLLIAAGVLPGDLTQDELDALTDAELADMIEDGKPATVEEDMQTEGDVQGTLWAVCIVSG